MGLECLCGFKVADDGALLRWGKQSSPAPSVSWMRGRWWKVDGELPSTCPFQWAVKKSHSQGPNHKVKQVGRQGGHPLVFSFIPAPAQAPGNDGNLGSAAASLASLAAKGILKAVLLCGSTVALLFCETQRVPSCGSQREECWSQI